MGKKSVLFLISFFLMIVFTGCSNDNSQANGENGSGAKASSAEAAYLFPPMDFQERNLSKVKGITRETSTYFFRENILENKKTTALTEEVVGRSVSALLFFMIKFFFSMNIGNLVWMSPHRLM